MNANRKLTTRTLARLMVVATVAAFGGCKSGSSGSGGGFASRGDPLLGGSRIPPQDLPIPGRNAYGSNDRVDPLLDPGKPVTPTGGSDRTDKGSKTPDSAKAPPPPYRPNRDATTAALAGIPTDDRDLSMGNRPGVLPAGGIPASIPAPNPTAFSGGFEQAASELRKMGATFRPPEQDDSGQYVFRCDVPRLNGSPGQIRRYEGIGSTPAAAARDALTQVQADRPSR